MDSLCSNMHDAVRVHAVCACSLLPLCLSWPQVRQMLQALQLWSQQLEQQKSIKHNFEDLITVKLLLANLQSLSLAHRKRT